MTEDQPSTDEAPSGEAGSFKDPVVLAAQRMVVEIFAMATAQFPELLKTQTPAGAEVQNFTDAMLVQLQAQVTRALGVGPDDDGESKT